MPSVGVMMDFDKAAKHLWYSDKSSDCNRHGVLAGCFSNLRQRQIE